MRLLSIDWDYFFEVKPFDPKLWSLYDWSHRDGGSMFGDLLWYVRARSFVANDIPMPLTTGEEVSFWDRFTFPKRAKLFVADSHSQIYANRVRKGIVEVANFDAHHDGGYKGTLKEWMDRGRVTCEDWAIGYQLAGARVRTIYPSWKSWAMDREPTPLGNTEPILPPVDRVVGDGTEGGEYDRIFVCRSSGWSPPWLDDAFDAFVDACPLEAVYLGDVSNRLWNQERLQAEVEAFRRLDEIMEQKGLRNVV